VEVAPDKEQPQNTGPDMVEESSEFRDGLRVRSRIEYQAITE